LPWEGEPEAEIAATKRELLTSTSSTAAAALTDGVECGTAAAALAALYEEVRRWQAERREGRAASVDYEACLAILGQR
jgi:hypothetical protein